MDKYPRDMDNQGRWPRELPPRPMSRIELWLMIIMIIIISLVLIVDIDICNKKTWGC